MINGKKLEFKSVEEQRLDKLIEKAKNLMPYKNVSWEEPIWNIDGNNIKRRHDKRKHNLFFTCSRINRKEKTVQFEKPFADFAKAFIVMRSVQRNAGYSHQKLAIDALRYLHDTLLKSSSATNYSNAPTPSQLTLFHFKDAVNQLVKTRKINGAYTIALRLQELSKFIDNNSLTRTKINFKNFIKRPEPEDGRSTEDQKKGLEKLPSSNALKALAEASNNPLDENEKIILRIIDLLVSGGFRIGEVLSLRKDCWVEEPILDEKFKKQVDPETGEPAIRCGIRYTPEKGGIPIIKWLPDAVVSLAKRSVDDLRVLCEDARKTAFSLEQNPGRIPHLSNLNPNDYLDKTQLAEILGLSNSSVRQILDFFLKLKPEKDTNARGRGQNKNIYRIKNFEQAYFKRRKAETVVLVGDGKTVKPQTLSESLCVMFIFQFDPQKSTLTFHPQQIGYRQIVTALGASKVALSIFTRRDITEPDGKRMHINTHAFRHWINTLADHGGLSDTQLALWMGRRDINQNAAYKHGTVAQRAEWARNALVNNQITGDIPDVYYAIKDPVEKESFLESFVNTAHITDYGICLHDFAIEPCKYHLNCLSGCSEFVRTKGDEKERENIRSLRVFTQRELELAKEAEEKSEYGAEAWVEHNRIIIAGCDAALAVDEEFIGKNKKKEAKVKVFPESLIKGVQFEEPII